MKNIRVAKKVKKNPTKYVSNDVERITKLKILNFEQILAWIGSEGQGASFAFQNRKHEINRKTPATRKICNLYWDKTIIQGNIDIKLANDAPMPRVTNNAGKAQQIKVLKLVNRVTDGVINCLNILLFTVYLRYIISRILNQLSNYDVIYIFTFF